MGTWVVEPNAIGGWDVCRAEQSKAAERSSTRADAESAAHRFAKRGGGEILVRDSRGRELARYTVEAHRKAPREAVNRRQRNAAATAAPDTHLRRRGLPDQPTPKPKGGLPVLPQQPERARKATRSTPTLDELVDDLLAGYRGARAAALKADLGLQKLIIRDLVRSGESALAYVNLHSGDQNPAAQRLSTFLHDLRREDWVKKAQVAASAGMTLAGVDTVTVVLTAIAGFISGFIVVAALAAEAVLGVLLAGGSVLAAAMRAVSLGAEGLERFFAKDMPGTGVVSAHIAEPERRLYAVTGGRPPLLRVTDSAGHAVKIGVAAIVAAVLFGAFLGLVAFLEPAPLPAP